MNGERITANFKRYEFACKCGCGFDQIDIGTVNRLQVVRDIVQIPIIICSGCRCPFHNKAIGGTDESYHLKGMGIDWHLGGSGTGDRLLKRLCEHLLNNWSGGFHYYPEENFCHIDTGPKRRW